MFQTATAFLMRGKTTFPFLLSPLHMAEHRQHKLPWCILMNSPTALTVAPSDGPHRHEVHFLCVGLLQFWSGQDERIEDLHVSYGSIQTVWERMLFS